MPQIVPPVSALAGQLVEVTRAKRGNRVKRQASNDSPHEIGAWVGVGVIIVFGFVFAVVFCWCHHLRHRRITAARTNQIRVNRLSGVESQPRTPAGLTFTEPSIELQHLPPRVYTRDGQHPAEYLSVPPGTPRNDGGRAQLPPLRTPERVHPSPTRAGNFSTSPLRGIVPAPHGTPESHGPLRGVNPADHNAPEPSSPLRAKHERAQRRRLIAAREMELREAAQRGDLQRYRATEAAMQPADEEQTEFINQAAIDTYALGTTVTSSDDSQFDILQRDPEVTPAFRAAQRERFQRLIDQGITPDQAIAVSEPSTEENNERQPLQIYHDTTRSHQILYPPRRMPSISTSAALPPAPLTSAARSAAIQLAPARIPERWQPQPLLHPDHPSFRTEGGVGLSSSPADSDILREPGPSSPSRRQPSPFDPVGIAWTEADTEETGGTGTGTTISDDPWLEEVLENRRRARRGGF